MCHHLVALMCQDLGHLLKYRHQHTSNAPLSETQFTLSKLCKEELAFKFFNKCSHKHKATNSVEFEFGLVHINSVILF